jgi:hypothetical protein
MDLLTIYTHHSELQVINSAIANLHTLQNTTTPAKPFPACCVFNSRSLATDSDSGDFSASRGYVITARRISHNWTLHSRPYRTPLNWSPTTIAPSLLSLPCRAQLNWLSSQSQSHIATDGQSVSLCVEPNLGLMTRYLLLFDSYGLIFVERPLWGEDGSVFCICCWPLPAQCFSPLSPLGLVTIFYRLRFETFLFVASYDTQEVFDPASTRVFWTGCSSSVLCNHFERTTSKTPFFYCCVRVRFHENVFTEPLLRNGRLFIHVLHSSGCTQCLFRGPCPAETLYATVFSHKVVMVYQFA